MATDSANPADTFSIALADSVDLSHAPDPANDSERLLFRLLFPTLVRLDCQGQVRPALAKQWERDSTGRTWTFLLRDDAQLGGARLDAPAVADGWLERRSALQDLGLVSVRVLDQWRLAATLADFSDSLPRIFADPRTAVTPPELPASGGRILARPDSALPVLEVTTSTGDLRDALDGGADLVVSRDPAVIEYAASRPEFQNFPLPWDRTYVLLQRSGSGPVSPTIRSDSLLSSLAFEAVRADARPAQRPFLWHGACAPFDPMPGTSSLTARLVYHRSDPVARQLAERITALAGDTVPVRAVGLDASPFDAAVRQGGDWGYILTLERRSLVSCDDSAASARVEPLIDTRPYAVVRRGSPPLTVDWDGTVRLLPQ